MKQPLLRMLDPACCHRFPQVYRSATALVALALVVIGGARYVTAAPAAQDQPIEIVMQQSFEATGLPAGAATGTAAHVKVPAGWSLKHVHGGPEYLYVIAGSVSITDAEGTRTYNAGDFAWVPAGHVHTGWTAEGAEAFILNIRPQGAQWIIPVQ